MQYGERFDVTYRNALDNTIFTCPETYRYVEYGDYHTNKLGEGLWYKEKQILGTCQFSVTGCKTEKAARAKLRMCVKEYE